MRFFKFGLFIALGAMMSSCVFNEEPEIEFPAEMCIEASGITESTATAYTSWLEVRHLNRKHVFETNLAYVTATDNLLSTDIRREKSALFSTATEKTLLECRTEGNIVTEKLYFQICNFFRTCILHYRKGFCPVQRTKTSDASRRSSFPAAGSGIRITGRRNH